MVNRNLENYYNKHKESVLVIGTVYGNERRVYGIGDIHPYATTNYSELIYEIGSITKLFTSSLLAHLHYDGFLDIDDSLGQYIPLLPPDSPVTFRHLATHTSGLPGKQIWKEITNLLDHDQNRDSCSVFSLSEAAFYLRRASAEKVGKTYRYSNAGIGLLGHILATEMQTSYELAVQDMITIPLEMPDTSIHLSPEAKTRLVPGYTGHRIAPPIQLKDFPGTGALRSTVSDLLTFLSVHMGVHPNREIFDIYSITQKNHFQKKNNFRVGLGWHQNVEERHYYHSGGTHGYRSFIGFNPDHAFGVVILSNIRNPRIRLNPTSIGMELLQAAKYGTKKS
nr:serine hydrolase domain-containing protein [Paenibacillus sp. Marseille-Q4541]